MRKIDGPLRRLEDQFGSANGDSPGLLIVMSSCAAVLALDKRRCVQILVECGFITPRGTGAVDLSKIPEGLNAKETERFLRENGKDLFR